MAGVNFLLRGISESVDSIFGSPEQNLPPTNEDDRYYADIELSSDDEESNLIHCSGSLRDIEEGHLSTGGRRGKRTTKLKLGPKSHAFYFMTTTCGFIGSVFSFNVGITFISQCPGNWILPCLLILMGATGAIVQLFIISKLLRKNFDGFKGYEDAALNISFVFLTFQWFIEMFILYIMDIRNDSSKRYCKPEFYRYTAIANLITILAFVVHYILKCSHQIKKE